MTKIQRIRKLIKWLIFCDFAENETEIAKLLGYTKSSLSQILNEKVPLSDKFIDKICSLDENINKVWIIEEKGSMMKLEKEIEVDAKLFSEKLIARQEQLIDLLEKENKDLKRQIVELKKQEKPNVHLGKMVETGQKLAKKS